MIIWAFEEVGSIIGGIMGEEISNGTEEVFDRTDLFDRGGVGLAFLEVMLGSSSSSS